MKSLVVEDDFVSRLVLQKMLAPYGQCDTAVNGVEAVNAFNLAMTEGEPYDLICLDIMMPEMDGKEALKIIREKEKEFNIHPSNETKIVMITALDTPKEVLEAYYKGGCTSYLIKPIEKLKIKNALKDLKLI
ncbi:MAG: response regulator [Melioribacteraceae bacterium]|jgi:two-component system chemotaxis response regulator CheY|nr:response regulator [Melioribacteraceae bacterium]